MPRPTITRPRRTKVAAPPRPRPSGAQVIPQAQAATLTAAGARVTTRPVKRPKGGLSQTWQDEAWYFHDTVGELAQAALWVGNCLTRVDLDVYEVMADGTEEKTTNPAALAALADLYDGDTGQPDMMARFGIHFTIPGESYLVGTPPTEFNGQVEDKWRVLSNQEIRQQGGQWIIEQGDGVEEKYADGTKPDQPAEALVIRIWRPHPAKWVHATSPVRAALPVLRRLEKVDQHIAASADSRLAGAGVFVIPKGATWETPTDPEGANVENSVEQSSVMGTLTDAMLTPIGDRGNASARVPIVMSLPNELVDKVNHITFDLPFDEQVIPLSDHSIRRLATALDMPAEVLLGQADSNHWSAWLISEDSIKVHIEPLVTLLCTALTQRYLWPILAGTAMDPLDWGIPQEVKRFVIKGDTSALRQRPDRTETYMALHRDMAVTNEALIREVGTESDDLLVPGSDEWRTRVLTKIASESPLPDMALAAINALGLGLVPEPATVTPAAAPSDVNAVPVAPEPAALPAPAPTGAPDRAEAVAASVAGLVAASTPQVTQYGALLAVADLAVNRALERAHARLFGRGKGRPRPVTDERRVTDALHDAWGLLPTVAADLGVDPALLVDGCDRYARELLGRGMEHNRDLLGAVLRQAVLGQQAA